jgi:hypothetical protein
MKDPNETIEYMGNLISTLIGLWFHLIRDWERIPNTGLMIIDTLGCPKSQNKYWYNVGWLFRWYVEISI